MPATPPTIIAPMPDDPRVIALAKSLGLSRREAFGAAAEAWAWMSRVTKDGVVVKADPDTLEGFVEVVGFAGAMVDAGLVGVVDGGLVLPAELRLDRTARGAGDETDAAERKKAQDRRRSRERYWRNKLNKPACKTSPPPPVEPAGPRPQPRSLGSVAGHPVMLLYRRRDGVPFYKLANATPNEFTGSVTDPENPSLEDALTAIHSAMLREAGKPGADGETFKPAVSVVAAAAGIDTSVTPPAPPAGTPKAEFVQEKVPQQKPAGKPAEVVANTRRPPPPLRAHRRIEGGASGIETSPPSSKMSEPAEAAATTRRPPPLREDIRRMLDDIDADPSAAEREISRRPHVLTRENAKPHADLTLTGEPVAVASPCHGNGLGAVQPHAKPHANLTPPAPSSNSSSSSLSQEREEEKSSRNESTATVEPGAAERDPTIRRRQRFERYAAALNTTVDAVEHQSRYAADTLLTTLRIAGIDPQTGFPVNADAPSRPSQARPGIDMTTEPTRRDNPATGILVAPAANDHERDDIAVTPDATASRSTAADLADALG